MVTQLDAAHSWFFDSYAHELNGPLIVHLTEGIKGVAPEFLEVGETKLGPYFPVAVGNDSQCARIVFPNTLAFLVYDESIDRADPELRADEGRFLRETEASTFQQFMQSRTSISELQTTTPKAFLLCCEDRIIQVLCEDTPFIELKRGQANLEISRTQTWSAK